jgi:hypothetical protein
MAWIFGKNTPFLVRQATYPIDIHFIVTIIRHGRRQSGIILTPMLMPSIKVMKRGD